MEFYFLGYACDSRLTAAQSRDHAIVQRLPGILDIKTSCQLHLAALMFGTVDGS